VKAAKRARPFRHGVLFWTEDPEGRVLVRRRPPEGLLGGMLELPGTPWRDEPWTEAEALDHAPLPGLAWQAVPGEARHGFTHFELGMRLLRAAAPGGGAPEGAAWMEPATARDAMPTVMRRAFDLAITKS
jgi:A/G-specific adenine glycosylase